MPKYEVTLYYHTSVTVTVRAPDEDDAHKKAKNKIKKKDLIANLQEGNYTDIEKI